MYHSPYDEYRMSGLPRQISLCDVQMPVTLNWLPPSEEASVPEQRPMVMQGPLDGFETLKSHSHRRCYCLFLRGDASDHMSRANVYSCSPKYWASCVLRLSWRCWSFNPLVYPQWWEQQKVSGNQSCCDNSRCDHFQQLWDFVLRVQVTHQTLNWLPARQRGSQVAPAPNGKG